ncbi:MAG: hypothetical protein IJG85_06185 [Eubacteriaceae bacterium]|nr:hypothetical protein [Eubacteriaceae bacterium]
MILTNESWRQTASQFNLKEAWPARLFPNAKYRYFRDCGCLVCALAVMLRHCGIEKEEGQSLFNPWVLNQRLIDCGAFTSDADLELSFVNRLYPVEYLGEFSYSREELVHLMEWDFPCLVTVPGSNAERHFIVPLFTVTEDVIVFDPLCGEKRLSTYNRICGIRRFADRIVMRPQG